MLVIPVAALVAGVAGVLTNDGSAHEFTGGFSPFGYDVAGSAGSLFPYGIDPRDTGRARMTGRPGDRRTPEY